jgi:hypothetical protein
MNIYKYLLICGLTFGGLYADASADSTANAGQTGDVADTVLIVADDDDITRIALLDFDNNGELDNYTDDSVIITQIIDIAYNNAVTLTFSTDTNKANGTNEYDMLNSVSGDKIGISLLLGPGGAGVHPEALGGSTGVTTGPDIDDDAAIPDGTISAAGVMNFVNTSGVDRSFPIVYSIDSDQNFYQLAKGDYDLTIFLIAEMTD